MEDLSLHILDIAENAVRAQAKNIKIKIEEDPALDRLIVSIEDDGKGMDKEALKKAIDPFYTTKENKKFGLGLSLFEQAAQQTGGSFKIDSSPGQGTQLEAVFKSSHPDIIPLGNIFETLADLIVAHPDIRFIYDYKDDELVYHFDSFKEDKK